MLNVLEKFKHEKIAVALRTVEEANSFLKIMQDNDMDSFQNSTFSSITKNMCMDYFSRGSLRHLSSEYYEKQNFNIVDYKDFVFDYEKERKGLMNDKDTIVISKDTAEPTLFKLSLSIDPAKRLQAAAHENTSPYCLNMLVHDTSQEVALEAVKNINTPTQTLEGIFETSKAPEIVKLQAIETLLSRKDVEYKKVFIEDKSEIYKFTSREEGFDSYSAVKVPLNDIYQKAIVKIPSYALKDTPQGKLLILNENKQYLYSNRNEQRSYIDGKELYSHFNEAKCKSLSLNERLDKATQKQAKETKQIEKSKETFKNRER